MMATVPDLSGNSPVIVDHPLCKVNRANAGTPEGSLTPLFGGELVYDTTNNIEYRGTMVGKPSWIKVQDNV